MHTAPSFAHAFRHVPVHSRDGSDVTVAVAGDRGPVLLCVNAIGMPPAFFAPLANALSASHRLICVGSRLRQPGDGRPAVAAQLDDIEDAYAQLCADEPVTVVGWCTGAHFALEFAAAHGPAVRSLVLFNGAFLLKEDVPETPHEKHIQDLFPRVVRMPALAHGMARAMQRRYEDPSVFDDVSARVGSRIPEVVDWSTIPFRYADVLIAHAQLLLDFWTRDSRATLDHIRCPVLAFAGESDVLVSPRRSELLAALLSDCELDVTVEGSHFRLYDDPTVAEKLAGFVAA